MNKKAIARIEIEPAKNGGHTVTHHYKAQATHSRRDGLGSTYVEPEHHVFGEREGHNMLAHVANQLGISEDGLGEHDEEEGAKARAGEGEEEDGD